MTFNFILDLIIIFCIGGMIYMLARVLPRISDTSEDNLKIKTSKILMYIEKSDERFRKFNEKFLRKVKIMVMKIDNYLGNKLSRSKKNSEKNENLGFNLQENSQEEEKEISQEQEEFEKEEDSI